jgi:drug/metabolite transporter (DMT)-like permease
LGSTFLATHVAVRTIPPFFVSGTRFFVAGAVLFAIGRRQNREQLGWKNWGAATLMGALFFSSPTAASVGRRNMFRPESQRC